MSISVVVITYNEERNIGRCLESVQGLADEIIVVDSFSTDNTENICHDYNAKFYPRKWEGYSKTKNFANSQANFSYVLSLDADEALSPELKASIQKEKDTGLNGVYAFNRLTNYCGKWIKHCGWYPDEKIRLFPKEHAKWKGDYVHETLDTENESVTHLSGDLHHYSFYSVKEHWERIENYSSLNAEKLLKKGKTGGPLKGVFSALSRFISMYFFKLGFLDGPTGFKICRISAYAAFLKYKKLAKLRQQNG